MSGTRPIALAHEAAPVLCRYKCLRPFACPDANGICSGSDTLGWYSVGAQADPRFSENGHTNTEETAPANERRTHAEHAFR
jgi:hypothetical protein